MNNPVTASVIGGGVGGRLSLAALQQSAKFRIAAAADVRPQARKALAADFPEARVFASHEEMFAECPTDVVCVSTYPPSHEAVVMAALEVQNLKGLLVEKPLGDTAAAGRRILDAICKRGLPMVVPHNLRALATPTDIVAKIREDAIGDLKLIEVQCDKWDILNAGIHWFEFCLAAAAETPIRSVLAACDNSTRTYRDGMQVETIAVTYVENEKGVRFVVQTGDYVDVNSAGKGLVFRLYGSAGFIEFWGWEPSYLIHNTAHPDGALITPQALPVTGHQWHLERLAGQIAEGKADYRLPVASQTSLEICESAFLSWKHRCLVRFPFASFVPPEPTGWEIGQPYSGVGGGRNGRELPEQDSK